jgi:hypothetical protein
LIDICSYTPIARVHSILRPDICDEYCLPYLDWGFGLTPKYRDEMMPLLVFGWDKLIQIVIFEE